MPKNYQVNIQDSSCLFTFNVVKNKKNSEEEKKTYYRYNNIQRLPPTNPKPQSHYRQQKQPEKSEYLLKTSVDLSSTKSSTNKPKKVIDIKNYGLNIKVNDDYILKKNVSQESEKNYHLFLNNSNTNNNKSNNKTNNIDRNNQYQKYRNYLITPTKLKSNLDLKPDYELTNRLKVDLSSKKIEKPKNQAFKIDRNVYQSPENIKINRNHTCKTPMSFIDNKEATKLEGKYISNLTPRIFTPYNNSNKKNDISYLKKPDNYKPTIKLKPFNYNSINRHFLDTNETLSSYFSLEKPSTIDKRNLFVSSSSLFLSKNNKIDSTFTNSMSRSLISAEQYRNLEQDDSTYSHETFKPYYFLRSNYKKPIYFPSNLINNHQYNDSTPTNLNNQPKSSIGINKATPRTPRTQRTPRIESVTPRIEAITPRKETMTPRKEFITPRKELTTPRKQREDFSVLKENSIFLESTMDLNKSMGSSELNTYIDRLINQFRLKTRLNENQKRIKNATPDSKEVNMSNGTERYQEREDEDSVTLVSDTIIISTHNNNNINNYDDNIVNLDTGNENEEIEESFLIDSPMNDAYLEERQNNNNYNNSFNTLNNFSKNNHFDDSTSFINFTHSYELDDTGSNSINSFDEELYYDDTNEEDTNNNIYT